MFPMKNNEDLPYMWVKCWKSLSTIKSLFFLNCKTMTFYRSTTIYLLSVSIEIFALFQKNVESQQYLTVPTTFPTFYSELSCENAIVVWPLYESSTIFVKFTLRLSTIHILLTSNLWMNEDMNSFLKLRRINTCLQETRFSWI